MTKIKGSHKTNRDKVCAPCGSKIVFGRRKESEFAINDKLQELIQNHLIKSFDISDDKFPTKICGSCRLTL